MHQNKIKCNCWHEAHCGFSCLINGCECAVCNCHDCTGPIPDTVENTSQYPVYPEDDGYDTPKNPYSQV